MVFCVLMSFSNLNHYICPPYSIQGSTGPCHYDVLPRKIPGNALACVMPLSMLVNVFDMPFFLYEAIITGIIIKVFSAQN